MDKNPLAVELCKVALWLESHNPGEPLGFLDHRIRCGDAIVGLARQEDLKRGIADEAFKALFGDNKTTASLFLKKNKQEKAQVAQLGLQFNQNINEELQEVIQKYNLFKGLPERSTEEVSAKEKAHRSYVKSVQRIRLQQLADMQVAQFFIPKTEDGKPFLLTDAEYRQFLRVSSKGLGPIQSSKAAFAQEVIAPKHRFFHWFLEFPDVFEGEEENGFDCFLGNPPFLGGKKISTYFGDSYNNWLKSECIEKASSDLVGFFFRRVYKLLNKQGFQALIATNTISQGDTRELALDAIIKQSGNIVFAIKSIKWPGIANVDVALISICKGIWNGRKYIGRKKVDNISTLLDDSEYEMKLFRLPSNLGKNFQGTIVFGTGFIISRDEVERLLKDDPKNAKVVQPYLSGEDLSNVPTVKATRFIINFYDWPIELASQFEEPFKIITNKVKSQRDEVVSKGKQIHEFDYWKYWDKRPELYSLIKKDISPLAVAAVSVRRQIKVDN